MRWTLSYEVRQDFLITSACCGRSGADSGLLGGSAIWLGTGASRGAIRLSRSGSWSGLLLVIGWSGSWSGLLGSGGNSDASADLLGCSGECGLGSSGGSSLLLGSGSGRGRRTVRLLGRCWLGTVLSWSSSGGGWVAPFPAITSLRRKSWDCCWLASPWPIDLIKWKKTGNQQKAVGKNKSKKYLRLGHVLSRTARDQNGAHGQHLHNENL